MRGWIVNTLVSYLMITMFVTIIIMAYVTFESIGLNSIVNVLLQSLLITIVNFRLEKSKQ